VSIYTHAHSRHAAVVPDDDVCTGQLLPSHQYRQRNICRLVCVVKSDGRLTTQPIVCDSSRTLRQRLGDRPIQTELLALGKYPFEHSIAEGCTNASERLVVALLVDCSGTLT
jgi:hypothetical protein